MKLIFLDIDGVLNSDEYASSQFYLTETHGMSDGEIMLIHRHVHIDPKALLLINDLVDRSGAEVILSSTWRAWYSTEEITEIMQKRGATFKIVGSTPILHGKVNSSRIPRAHEIQAYLKSLTAQPDAFVILDDVDDMFKLKKNLVLTNMKFGITTDDVEAALKILGN